VRDEARSHLSILAFLSTYSWKSFLIPEIIGELLTFSPLVGYANQSENSFTPIPTIPEHVHYYPYLNSLCLGCLATDASGQEEAEAVAGMTDVSFTVILNCVESLSCALQSAWLAYNYGALPSSAPRCEQLTIKCSQLRAKEETFSSFVSGICLRFVPLLSRLALAAIIHMAKGRATDPMTQRFVENDDVRQALSDVRSRYCPTDQVAISVGGFYPSEVETAQTICTGPGSLSEPSQFPFISPFSTLTSETCMCNRLSNVIVGDSTPENEELGAENVGDGSPRSAQQSSRGYYSFPVSAAVLCHLRPNLLGGDGFAVESVDGDILCLSMDLFVRLMSVVSLPFHGEVGEARQGTNQFLNPSAPFSTQFVDQMHREPSAGAESPRISFSQQALSRPEPVTPTGSHQSITAHGGAIPHSTEPTAESTISSDLGISLMAGSEKADAAKNTFKAASGYLRAMPPVALTLFRVLGGEFTSLSSEMLAGWVTDRSVYERYAPFLLNAAVLSFTSAVFLQVLISHCRGTHEGQGGAKRLCPAAYPERKYASFLSVLSQAGPVIRQLRLYLELGSSLSHNLMLLMEREKLHKSAHEQAAFLESKAHLCIADQMPKPGFFSPAPRIPGELYTLPDLRTAFRKAGQSSAVPGGPNEVGTADGRADQSTDDPPALNMEVVARQFAANVSSVLGLPDPERAESGCSSSAMTGTCSLDLLDDSPTALRKLVVSSLATEQRMAIGLTNAELSNKFTTTLLRHWDFQDHEHLLFSSLSVYYLNLYSLSMDAYQMLQDNVQFTRRTEPDLASHTGCASDHARGHGRDTAQSGHRSRPSGLSQSEAHDSKCSISDSASGCASTFSDEERQWDAGREGRDSSDDVDIFDRQLDVGMFFRFCEATPTACMLAAPRQLENSPFSLRHYATLLYAPVQHNVERMELGARLARIALGRASPLTKGLKAVTGSSVYPALPSVLYLPCIRTSAYRESVMDILSQRPSILGVRFGDARMAMSYDVLLASERVWGRQFSDGSDGGGNAGQSASRPSDAFPHDSPGVANHSPHETPSKQCACGSHLISPENEVLNPLLLYLGRKLASETAEQCSRVPKRGTDISASPGVAALFGTLQREARNSTKLRLLLGNLYSDDLFSVQRASSLTAIASLPATSREFPTVSPYKAFAITPILAGTVDTYAKALTASVEVGVSDEGAFLDLLTFMQPKLVSTFSRLHAATTCQFASEEDASSRHRAVIDLSDAFTQDPNVPGGYRLTLAEMQQRIFHSANRAEIHKTMPAMDPRKLMAAQFLTSASFVLHSKPAYLYNESMMSLLSFLLRTLGHFPTLHEVEDIVDVLPTLILISRCITLMPTTELAIYLAFFGSGGTRPVSPDGRKVFAEAIADILLPPDGEGRDSSAAEASDPPIFPFNLKIVPSIPGEEQVIDSSGQKHMVPAPIKASTLLPTDEYCFLDPKTQRVTVYSTESCVFYSLPLRIFLAAKWYFRALLSAQVILVVLLRGMDGTTMLGSILQGSLNTGPRHRRTYLTRLFLLAFSVYSQACVSQLGLLYPPELPRCRGASEGDAAVGRTSTGHTYAEGDKDITGSGNARIPSDSCDSNASTSSDYSADFDETPGSSTATTAEDSDSPHNHLSTDTLCLTADPWEFARRFRDLIIGPLGGIVSGIIADTLNSRARTGGRRTRLSPATSLAYRCLDLQNLSHLAGELAGKYLFYQSSGYIDPRLFGASPACYTLIRPFNSITAAYLMSSHGFSLAKGQAHLSALISTLPPPFLHLVEAIRQRLDRVHSDILIEDPDAPDQSFQEFHFFVSLDQIVASWLLCGGLEEIEERERQAGGVRRSRSSRSSRSSSESRASRGPRTSQTGTQQGSETWDQTSQTPGQRGSTTTADTEIDGDTDTRGHALPTRRDMENLATMFCLVKSKYLLQ